MSLACTLQGANRRGGGSCLAAKIGNSPPYTRGMTQSLWAPWRMAYIRGLESQAEAARAAPAGGSPNFLAEYWAHPERDREQRVVFRDDRGMILLNRYPYTNGHLLVALGEAQPTIDRYPPPQRAHFWLLMERAMDLCQRTFEPQGMNVGINLGRAGGAGLPEHLHGHVVPRWAGDTNFMSVLGGVRMIPDSLERAYEAYRATAGHG